MKELLNKKISLSKKVGDKYQSVAWIERSKKCADSLSCAVSVERIKKLLEAEQGKYLYLSVFVNEVEDPADKEEVNVDYIDEDIPF